MKILKKILIALVLVFLIAQLFKPSKNNGDMASVNPFLQETTPSQGVIETLKTACFDCHSNHTNYPWYSAITPVNYWLADHVNSGKKHLNFSDWVNLPNKKKDHKMDELIEEINKGEMPLNSYTWVHKSAKLTESQKKELLIWAKLMRVKYTLGNQPQ